MRSKASSVRHAPWASRPARTVCGDSGKPLRSKDARRTTFQGAAAAAGVRPRYSTRASTNVSIGLRTQRWSWTAGNSGRNARAGIGRQPTPRLSGPRARFSVPGPSRAAGGQRTAKRRNPDHGGTGQRGAQRPPPRGAIAVAHRVFPVFVLRIAWPQQVDSGHPAIITWYGLGAVTPGRQRKYVRRPSARSG